ncbi:MAG: inverse autotransporter beta domain-containing protein [Schlesneria sp.]
MLLRSRSASVWNVCQTGIRLWVTFMVAIGGVSPRVTRADDWISIVRGQSDDIPPAPEAIGEEVDIFTQRAREKRKEERLAAKARQKGKAPPTVKNFFSMTTPNDPREISDGFGAIGRASFLAGKTFGRSDSIVPLEVMPYMLSDEHFVFADVRGFESTRSRFGGNAGLGYRHLRDDWNAWGGASVWYDADDTTSKLFQQIGLSFEGLIDRYELRSNVYLPISNSQTFSNSISGEKIVGNQLLYGTAVNQGTALRGVDFEVGYSMPIRDRHWLRGFVGGYHFEGGSKGNVDGFKMRVEGVYNNGVTAQLLYTNDQLYGSNLMAGISLQLPYGNNNPTSGWKQPTPSPFRFVERLYNVIVSRETVDTNNKVAINPATGKPYQIEQVYEAGQPYNPLNPILIADPIGITNPIALAPGYNQLVQQTGDGTTAHPFNSIGAAIASGGDVIYVRSGTIINESITLSAGQHLIGESNTASGALAVPGGGTVFLPHFSQTSQTTNSTLTPRFEATNGNAITLASNNEVSGFTFNHVSGDGIIGNNVSGAHLHDLTFNQVGNDAIRLTGSSGNVNMDNIQVNSAGGNGIVVDGGNANLAFNGLGTTITSQGDGFVLSNTQGGSISLANLTVKGTGGAGLSMTNVGTDVTVASLNTTQTFGPAVAISGTTGVASTTNGTTTTTYNTYNFTGYTTINSPNGKGFTVNASDALININNLNVTSTSAFPAISLVNGTSEIFVSNMTLNTTNATGLYARGDSFLQINKGTINAVNAPAVDVQGSTINAALQNVSVNGGPFGISLVQSQGNFTVQGNGNLASGGTIQNTGTGLIVNSFGQTNISWVDFKNNAVGVQSTKSGQIVLNNVRITGSSGYAVDSLDDATLILANSQLTGNGATGGGTIRVQGDTLGTFNSRISGNTISDANGTAILFQTLSTGSGSSLATTVNSNTITGYHGGNAVVNVNWSGPESITFSNNNISAQGAGMTGFLIQETSTTGSMAAQVSGNTATFANSQGTGVSFIAAGTSILNVTTNTFTFNGAAGIGERFALTGTSTDYIASNIITDGAGGLTGMLFDNVAANSRLQIDGNTINLLSKDLTTHQGIIFTSVAPTIQFTGTVNNLIYNAATSQSLFSAPVNSFTGGFYINGNLE